MKVYIELEIEVDYHVETEYIAGWQHSEEVLIINSLKCEDYPDLDLWQFEEQITKQIIE